MHTHDPDTLLDALTTVTRSEDAGESNDDLIDTDSLDDHECEELDLQVDAILAAVRQCLRTPPCTAGGRDRSDSIRGPILRVADHEQP